MKKLLIKIYLACEKYLYTTLYLINFLLEKKTNATFNSKFYLALYPDIGEAGMDPYVHYMKHGKKEGRIGTAPKISYIGNFKELDPLKENILIVSHEASRTGAPILALNIIQNLNKKYNVIAMLLGKGELSDEFIKSSHILVNPINEIHKPATINHILEQLLSLCNIKFAIVNSVASSGTLPQLSKNFIPAIILIHEFYACSHPKNNIDQTLLWASQVVFSADIVWQSWSSNYFNYNKHEPLIIPQGQPSLPTHFIPGEKEKILATFRPASWPPETIVILGAGYVQYRKGVDLFIACAKHMLELNDKTPFRFIWVGDGYFPEEDINYSAYLKDQVKRANLENVVAFIDAVSDITFAYEQADILLLTSRLDPLPNVCIDALTHGLPVVCFDKTSGIADILKNNSLETECVAPYLDIEKISEKINLLISSKELRNRVGQVSKIFAKNLFNLHEYVNKIETIALTQCKIMQIEKEDTNKLAQSKQLNSDFLTSPPISLNNSTHDIARHYVRSWRSFSHKRKPQPGFHPYIYLQSNRHIGEDIDPFLHFIQQGKPDGPWKQEVITPAKRLSCEGQKKERVALHLHAYYSDVASEIIMRLNKNVRRPDLFISIPSEQTPIDLQEALSTYNGTIASIETVPNRGRDIGPLLTTFGKRLINNYDIVCHVHTKKSLVLSNPIISQQWLSFLLENLIGGVHLMTDCILHKMESDSTIGLAFPDDPNIIGWCENRPYASRLSDALGIECMQYSFFNFPVGTMFWARTEALAPLINLNLTWKDYPEEPLPYDGSILHAIERILPFVSEKAGFRNVLTHVPSISR